MHSLLKFGLKRRPASGLIRETACRTGEYYVRDTIARACASTFHNNIPAKIQIPCTMIMHACIALPTHLPSPHSLSAEEQVLFQVTPRKDRECQKRSSTVLVPPTALNHRPLSMWRTNACVSYSRSPRKNDWSATAAPPWIIYTRTRILSMGPAKLSRALARAVKCDPEATRLRIARWRLCFGSRGYRYYDVIPSHAYFQ